MGRRALADQLAVGGGGRRQHPTAPGGGRSAVLSASHLYPDAIEERQGAQPEAPTLLRHRLVVQLLSQDFQRRYVTIVCQQHHDRRLQSKRLGGGHLTTRDGGAELGGGERWRCASQVKHCSLCATAPLRAQMRTLLIMQA